MTERTDPGKDFVRLSTGIYVPRASHDRLYALVAEGILRLEYGRPYKARDMVDPHEYVRHDPWQVGCCVADWERRRKVPVRFLGCRYCSVRYYERT